MAKLRRISVAVAILSLGALPTLAFKPGIHKEITKTVLQAISKTVGSQTYKFTDKAIDEVMKANADTDCLSCQGHSEFHFDDEDFPGGSQRLINLKNAILQDLSGTTPNGKKAREHLGQALHTLQDFYAHSTRVELGQSSFDSLLGVSTFNKPAASVLVCPTDPGVRAGDGLTTVTSGYFKIPLCDPPAGKCRHGIPVACPAGLNKDDKSRPNFQAAHDLAVTATRRFVNDLILNDSSITNNAKAVRALMGVTVTLAMAVDTTGSMGDVIGSVKTRIGGIVNGVVGTPDEPDQYLLEPFNDPFFGPPTVTDDAPTYLAQVNGLSAFGGGDCPELAMSGLLEAVNNVDEQSTIWLFTDASALDSQLSPTVFATAREKKVQIKYGLFGSCSPIDPAYLATAQGTGGQVFFLNRFFETGSLFDLVAAEVGAPQVTIAHQSGILALGIQQIPFPVDSAVSTFTVSATVDSLSSVTLSRPDGSIVAAGDPDVSITPLSVGAIFVIHTSQTGSWVLEVQGGGSYSADMKAKATRELQDQLPNLHDFNFVTLTGRVGHEGYFPIQGQPVMSDPQTVVADLSGPVNNVSFSFISDSGNPLQALTLAQGDPNATPDEFVGSATLPSERFQVLATGLDGMGAPFQRTFSLPFHAQNVKVTPLTFLDGLPQGQTVQLNFQVTNAGTAPDSFNIAAQDSSRFIFSLSPSLVTLNPGASTTVTASLSVPTFVALGNTDSITVLATSTGDPNSSNSATQKLNVLPAFSFNGGGQRPSDVNLFLAYASPTDSPVALAAGTSTFPLSLAYSVNINATTFSATLNGVDISSSFHPSPGTFETVTLSLQPGKNTLLLSVDGTRSDGHVARDKDTLVFNVQ